jgi:hypothetical protein
LYKYDVLDRDVRRVELNKVVLTMNPVYTDMASNRPLQPTSGAGAAVVARAFVSVARG